MTSSLPRPREQRVVMAIVAIATALSLTKAYLQQFGFTGMWPYWAVTYRHGFIRRGLLGTLFQLVCGRQPVDVQKDIVFDMHYVFVGVLFCAVVAWAVTLGRHASARTRALLVVGTSGVLLSYFFPIFANTSSYFDIYVILLAVIGAFLVSRGRRVAGALVAAPGPLIHDEMFFLWLPVLVWGAAEVLAASDRRAALRRNAVLVLPNVVALLVLELHSHDAFMAMTEELPPDWRLIRIFEMPLHAAMARLWQWFSEYPTNALRAALFYGWPFAITATCAILLSPLRRPWNVVVAILTTLAPCSVLIVAWDLSRYLVWAGYGSLLALFWSARNVAEDAPSSLLPREQWLWRLAPVPLVVLAIGGPNCYSYFDDTWAAYGIGGNWQRHTPAAAFSYAYMRAQREVALKDHYSLVEKCPRASENVRFEWGCIIDMDRFAHIESPIMGFPAGHYQAHLVVQPREDCAASDGVLGAYQHWRLTPQPDVSMHFDARQSSDVRLDFDIDAEAEAMAGSGVYVTTWEGCLVVRSLEVTRR